MTEEVQEEQSFEDAFAEFADGERKETDNRVSYQKGREEVEDEPAEQEPEPEQVETTPEPEQEPETDMAAEVEKWKHRSQSDAGRVAALQRKLNEVEAERQTLALEQPPQAADTNGTPPDTADFDNEYPDISRAMKAQMEAEMQKQLAAERESILNAVDNRLSPLNDVYQQQQTAAEQAALTDRHPDWQQIAQDQAFGEWAAAQPPQIQQLAGSDFAGEVSYALDLFKSQTQSPQTQQVSGIAQKREQQLKNAEAIPSRRTATQKIADDDYSSAFAHYAAKS